MYQACGYEQVYVRCTLIRHVEYSISTKCCSSGRTDGFVYWRSLPEAAARSSIPTKVAQHLRKIREVGAKKCSDVDVMCDVM
jgi:hypothetical protein